MTKTTLRMLAAAGLATALAGCLAPTLDETTVFRPPATQKALTIAEMALRGQERLGPDVSIRHGFLGEGEDRIAYTVLARPGEGRPMIVHCGGNASDRRRDGAYYAGKALPFGDVILLDYPGYGDSGGQTNRKTLDAFTVRAVDFARATAGAQKLVFWGHSLGGFVCSQLVRQAPEAAGMIYEASAPSVAAVAAEWTPWFAKPFVRPKIDPDFTAIDNVAALEGFRGKVLVLGAGLDFTLSVKLSRALAAAQTEAGRPTTYVEFPRAGHSSIPEDAGFQPAVLAFFQSIAAPAAEKVIAP